MMTARATRRPILIMAGGTGGHVFPALAVAEELSARGIPVSWLGTRRGLEARVVPEAGYPLETVRVTGLRGRGALRLLGAPFMLAVALFQALRIELRLRPLAVLGMGGFASGPGGVTAWLLRRPLLIHEQNSVAGTTNRWLAPLARTVMVAFPGSLAQRHRPVHTGNPIRGAITGLAAPAERFEGRSGPLRILVVGGSLGASALNSVVPAAIAQLASCPELYHQTGSHDIEQVRNAYTAAGIEAQVEPFIEDMAAAYAWADLVICRSGALTVAELAVVGVAAILVPFPHATDDHQTGNARFLADAGAAVLLPQDTLTPARLTGILADFSGQRAVLLEMAERARALAMPDAARRVAELCLQAAGIDTRTPDAGGVA
jgi:UDP-N-acetylglucosamine--N-acetylmuramyl-(pentapeptide) pyrophosphoryl-undecaprenol N-acetylglucosamine transferase